MGRRTKTWTCMHEVEAMANPHLEGEVVEVASGKAKRLKSSMAQLRFYTTTIPGGQNLVGFAPMDY